MRDEEKIKRVQESKQENGNQKERVEQRRQNRENMKDEKH